MGPRRRNQGAIAANPILIGAATTLIVIVAVFLAYNANNGLPFVPTYDLNADVSNASGLIRNNDVRLGGSRVGSVAKITAVTGPNGTVHALLRLELDKRIEPLPVDSTLLVRPRSPLGLKYVELTRGRSTTMLKPDATIGLSGAPRPVEIDDFFDVFDAPTRAGSRTNLDEFGTAFAGRGADLNAFFAELGPVVRKLDPVMRTIMDPRTGWARFFPSLEQAAREVAPVAARQGQLFVGLYRTFAALDGARTAVQETISGGPAALDVATRELPAQSRFVRDSTELFRRFRPAFASLASASVALAPAFRAGVPALRRAPALNGRLVDTEKDLQGFGADARVVPGIERLGQTATALDAPLRFIAPVQTTCNAIALFFSNLASSLSEADQVGTFLRAGILALPQQAGSEAGPAATPANGPGLPANATDAQVSLSDDSFLHSNPYPNAAAPGQATKECEAGNESYAPGHTVIGNEPGNQTTVVEPTKRVERK